jgi:hypothetical protein
MKIILVIKKKIMNKFRKNILMLNKKIIKIIILLYTINKILIFHLFQKYKKINLLKL